MSHEHGIDTQTLQGKREVLANLRHELRTPLNAIIGYSEMLLEDAEDAAETPSYVPQLARVLAAGRVLLSRVNDVLDAGRLETAEEINLNSYSERINAELSEPLQDCLTCCDLLIEEAKRCGDEEVLEEIAKVKKAAQKLAALLETDTLLSEAIAGHRHDELPELEENQEDLAGPGEDVADGDSSLILVVDDNETNRDLLSRRLVRQGYEVLLAGDGYEALRQVASGKPDLILLDIMMPGLDGYQVLERLKAHSEWRHVPVLMISALDEIGSVVRCIEMGAEDYLPKPFNPVLLRARVRASLEKKRLRDQEVRLFDQLQENYEKLRELEQLRDSLTHMVVHDLRTPLTAIISGLQTLEMVGELDEVQTEVLGMSLTGGETLLRMINDLLDISKMEAGQLSLEKSEFQASKVVLNCLQQVVNLAKNKSLNLINECPDVLPAVWADEDKVMRTLTNLLGNAIKFTPFNGSVTVRVSPSEDGGQAGLHFAVIDTGEGIPGDAFERIFEKFGQVETRKAGRSMSTGLGLTFCKMAVEAHGGRIWVDSEVGVGSTFQFFIPLAEPA